MTVLRVFSARILISIFLFITVLWSLYLFLTLLDERDVTVDCSWCRTMGFESVERYVSPQGVEDREDDPGSIEMPMYVKQLDMIENGKSVLYYDRFVPRGLTELSLIRKSTDNIFFVESSCVLASGLQENASGVFTLDARQACGVESAARANPDRPVYILHSCPLADDFTLRVPEYARALLDLHNVYVVALDVAELSKDWPDPLPTSSISLGLLALWQFGGTYCDLDTLVLRSLHPLGTNYCGYRDDHLLVGDQVLNFEPLGYGHSVVTLFLYDLTQKFGKFSNKEVLQEGETHLTRVVIDQCIQLPMSVEDCNKLTIYDNTVLFTVGLTYVPLFLSDNIDYEFVDRIKMTAFTINYVSRLYSFSGDKKPNQAFLTLAKEFCPDVYARCDHTF